MQDNERAARKQQVEGQMFNSYGAELWLNEELGPNDIVVRRQTDTEPEPVVLHGHSFYELVFIKSSGGAKYLVGETVYALRDKDVLLIPPGVNHSPVLSGGLDGSFQRDVIWFNRNFVTTHLGKPGEGQLAALGRPWLLHIPAGEQPRVEELFARCLWESQEQHRCWDRIVQVITVYILCMLSRVLEEHGFPLQRDEVPLMLQIIDYVEQNLKERITLESTAARFGVSRSTLSDNFRKKTGVGFYAYVIQRRLIEARNLICEGYPMEQVARRVGFGEYSAFYRAFRQRYGISPRQFREQCSQNGHQDGDV